MAHTVKPLIGNSSINDFIDYAKLTKKQAEKLYDGRNTVTKWDDVFKLVGTTDDKKKGNLKNKVFYHLHLLTLKM